MKKKMEKNEKEIHENEFASPRFYEIV